MKENYFKTILLMKVKLGGTRHNT